MARGQYEEPSAGGFRAVAAGDAVGHQRASGRDLAEPPPHPVARPSGTARNAGPVGARLKRPTRQQRLAPTGGSGAFRGCATDRPWAAVGRKASEA